MKESYTDILANKRNGTLYVGSTAHLVRRIWEHKENIIPGFTKKYSVHRLVYYEAHENITKAAHRERRIKNWCREWKINLINSFNPNWRDLYEDIIL